ncbi:MAG TPA: BamA/TamA family outer membrane protein [Nitrospiraceae bacterium]|nr:BamA/TamA family outer membrane protein [Nitrospiraceae bacterium]
MMVRTSIVLRFVLFLLMGFGWIHGIDPPARADISYFPIPSVSTSRNDGNDAGFIVPMLITAPDGELKYLVAPMFIVNSIVGARGSLNIFRYEPGGRQFRFIGSYTEEIERKLVLSYTDPAFSRGRYAFDIGGSFFKNATSRFFGIGQQTSLQDESNYTAREVRANWRLGLHLNEVTQISIGQRFREVRVERGAVQSLPFSGAVYPQVDGMQGASIFGHRATFYYDTRDSLVVPTVGAQFVAYAEVNQNLRNGDNPVYYRYGLEFKKLFPSESKRMILVIRGDLQTTFGHQIPFYERSSLGGQNNLRGYGVDRFIDDHMVALSFEQRIHVMRAKIANVAADFEIAPFVDMGKVFNTFRKRQFRDYEVTPGIGFRGIVRPSMVGRIDYGYSEEGGAVFAGLDFPF